MEDLDIRKALLKQLMKDVGHNRVKGFSVKEIALKTPEGEEELDIEEPFEMDRGPGGSSGTIPLEDRDEDEFSEDELKEIMKEARLRKFGK